MLQTLRRPLRQQQPRQRRQPERRPRNEAYPSASAWETSQPAPLRARTTKRTTATRVTVVVVVGCFCSMGAWTWRSDTTPAAASRHLRVRNPRSSSTRTS